MSILAWRKRERERETQLRRKKRGTMGTKPGRYTKKTLKEMKRRSRKVTGKGGREEEREEEKIAPCASQIDSQSASVNFLPCSLRSSSRRRNREMRGFGDGVRTAKAWPAGLVRPSFSIPPLEMLLADRSTLRGSFISVAMHRG